MYLFRAEAYRKVGFCIIDAFNMLSAGDARVILPALLREHANFLSERA
jgi:hypothetical protein